MAGFLSLNLDSRRIKEPALNRQFFSGSLMRTVNSLKIFETPEISPKKKH
jgi:hypothetical protein